MKKITLILFALFTCWQINAQSIVIGTGTGTTTSSGSDPIDGYYESFRYQVVYTAAELSATLTPYDEITGLGFSIAGDYAGGDLLGYTIKMGHTSATNSATHNASVTTVVKTPFNYNPTVTADGVFDMITFDSNFIWNGVDNVLVEICSDGPNSYVSPYGQVRMTTMTTGSRYYRVDGDASCNVNTNSTNDNRPNIQFNYVDGTPPACLAPNALTATNLTSASAQLGWTENGTATLWNIEYGVSGFTPGAGTTLSGVTNSYLLSGLSPNTMYQYYVQADCGGTFSAWSGPFTFATLCNTVTDFVQNFDGITTPAFPDCWKKVGTSGTAYTQTTNPNSSPNTLYLYSSATTNLAVVAMQSISNLGDGTHRLRLDMRANFTVGGVVEFGYLTNPNDASSFVAISSVTASSLSYEQFTITPVTGSYSDYPAFRHTGSPANSLLIDNVIWEPIPSCVEPNTIIASNITSGSVDLSWIDGSGGAQTDYEYAIQAPATGIPAGAGTPITALSVNGESFDINGNALTPNTSYEVYVRSNCGGGDFSPWVGPITFRTLCQAINTFPFVETFDVASTTESCWSVINGNADFDLWNMNGTSIPRTGQAAELYTDFNSVNNDYLVTPQLNLGSVSKRLKFWVRHYSNSEPDNLNVKLSTTDGNIASFTNTLLTLSTTQITTTYTEYVVDLSSYTGLVYIAFARESAPADGWYISIDDVSVEDIPSCVEPNTIIASNITTNSVDLSWTDGSGGLQFDYEYAIQAPGTGIPAGAGAPIDDVTIVDEGFDIDGNPLTPNTLYEVYVRADCGGSFSTWTGPITFRTACETFTVPFTEGFNSTSTSEGCWTVLDGNADADTWNTNYDTNPFEGDQSAMINTDFNNGANNDWLISPTITLTGNQRLKFHYRVQSAGEPNDFELLLSTTGNTPASFTNTLIANTSYSNITYVEQVVDLSAYSGNVNIAWHVPAGGLDGWRLYIDNVIVEDIPSCTEPTVFTIDSVGLDSATVSWTAGATETEWEYVIQAQGTGVPAGAGISTTSNPLTISGLSSNTPYEIYLRAICSVTEQSIWVGPYNIKTNIEVVCGTPVNTTYCYTDNDTTAWTFTSSDGSLLRVIFNAGQVENTWDELIVLDSDGVTQLYNGYGAAGNLAGLIFDSTGDTITVKISSDGSGNCGDSAYTSWDFDIACATCVNPTVDFSTPNNCPTADFNVVANITNLGTATSLTVSDNQGSTPQVVTSTGNVTFGPFAFGTNVVITAVNNQDNSCSVTSANLTLAGCPPVNDDCDNAVALTVNTDLACSVVTPGTTLYATNSGIEPTFTVSGTPDNDVWFSFIATGPAHRVSLSNVVAVSGFSTDMGMAVFDGSASCNALVLVGSSDPNTYNLTGLTAGVTYYVSVYGWGSGPGAQATFDICVGTPPAPPANDNCANAIAISAMPYTNSQDASSATGPVVSTCTGMNDGVWYTVVGNGGNIIIDVTAVTGWDPELGVYTGSCGTFTCVASIDEGGASDGETYTIVSSTLGTTYYINVGHYSSFSDSPEGPFTIGVTTTLSSGSFDNNSFVAYPNPVKDIFNVSYSSEISAVRVLNLLGQEVISQEVNTTSAQIDMSQLSTGTYIVNVTVGDAIKVIKVVKQ